MSLKLLYIIPLALLSACSANSTKVKNDSATTNIKAADHKLTFLDSVLRQDTFTTKQIKKHLSDSSFISRNSHFSGDTVYYAGAAYSIVILRDDDHAVCSRKYLLVYKTGVSKNISGMQVVSDCDEDSGTNYFRMEFKTVNSTQFYTREVAHLREPGQKTKVTVTDTFYEIDGSGQILSLSKKPAGIVLPVFDKDNELDEDDEVN
jgi:hypothetical protein